MSYETEQQEFIQRLESNSLAAESLAGLRQVFRAYPQSVNNSATVGILEEYCQPGPVTLDAIRFAFENNSPLLTALNLRTEEGAREAFIDAIVDACTGDKVFLRKNLSITLNIPYNKKPVPLHSTETLQTRADNIAVRKEYESMTVRDLRKQVRTDNPPYVHTFPALPAEVTKSTLMSQKITPPSELRRLIKIYGHTQVSNRLMGKS